MVAEILSVGTELLLGNIVNTNAAFLSQELAGLGVSVFRQTTVGDNHKRLFNALGNAFSNADVVIISGGLGPTLDDITKEVAAEYFGRKLILHEESLERIKIRFAARGREMPTNSNRNAIIPENSLILPNDNGSAPGVVVEGNGKTLILLPGPPHEMIPMFTNYVAPFLQQKSGRVFVSRTLKIIGIGESQVESMLMDLITAQTNPTIAPYAKVSDCHVRLTASAECEKDAEKLIAPIAAEIHRRLNPHIYSDNDLTLPEIVVSLLETQNHTLAVAESCTGGLIMSELVSVAGCSSVFMEGLCAYSNKAKITRLGVPANLLQNHGAVSAEVAAAMAERAAKVADTSVGLSTTGIAGPDGGSAEKPVGLVYIGLCINDKVESEKFNITGSRNEVRVRAANLAMDMLRRKLERVNH
ncbi:MAG: competence/damage-inducible protein A [Firmicutes bacterium]|nr:competence/damage-inducible protein A [Bacillota bacterium]